LIALLCTDNGDHDQVSTYISSMLSVPLRSTRSRARASNLKDQGRLLIMAEAWLNIADRIARLLKRPKIPVGEHPAVSSYMRDLPRRKRPWKE
jgi:hypothetical protein